MTVVRDGDEQPISAPGVELAERGRDHGTHNDGDVTVLTAGLCPLSE